MLLFVVVFVSLEVVSYAQSDRLTPRLEAFNHRPFGIHFPTVSPDPSRSPQDAYLFDASSVENKKLSLSFKVSHFKHASQDQFRANPALFTCLQKVQNAMQSVGERVEIVSGYVPPALAGSTKPDSYQSTGAAVRIRLKSGGTQTMENLAKAAVKQCVPFFQEINRDIGIALYTDKVQISIQGPESGEYYFKGPGVSIDLETLALESIDEAYDIPMVAECPNSSPSLTSGKLFPETAASLEEVVGRLDMPITRADVVDFGRLTQYPARHIVFENSEHTASWCGAVGTPCADCRSKIAGSTLNAKCADRTMTPRLLRFLVRLGKAVQLEWSGVKLKVKEAWDEPYEGKPTGDQPAGSLHFEGRAAIVVTSDGSSSKLNRLSQLAICAGVDAVQHKGDHLVLAVLKQRGTEARSVVFSDNQELLEVDPPAAKESYYALKEEFSESEARKYPLFDGDSRENFQLSQDVTLGMFMPHDGRYLRVSLLIVNCLQAIIIAEKNRGIAKPLVVCRSFYNRMEVEAEIDFLDKRYSLGGLGLSMELSYDCSQTSSEELDLYDQAQLVIEECAPIFYKGEGKSIGVGIYDRFVAVDVRSSFKAWASHEDLRGGTTPTEFNDYYQRWATRAIQGRIVDPDDNAEVCKASTQPMRQEVDFRHKFPEKNYEDDEYIDPDRCIPKNDTKFCQTTQIHRDKEIKRIWAEVTRKYLAHDRVELEDALKKCIGTCGTCQEGTIWKMKVENCENLLHWLPFGFLNEYSEDAAGDDVNLYLQEAVELKHYACAGYCLNKAPLFSLLVPTLEKLYRPNEKQSIQETLYSTVSNPSPVYELMHNLFAMHAKGIVKVWVKNERELITMKEPLKHIFLYNLNVTKVEIAVAQSPNKPIVSSIMQTFISEWSKRGCRDYAREFLPPFTVCDLPAHMSKRSAEHELREAMLHRHRSWEDRWLNNHPLM